MDMIFVLTSSGSSDRTHSPSCPAASVQPSVAVQVVAWASSAGPSAHAVGTSVNIIVNDNNIANNRRFMLLPPKSLSICLPASAGWVYIVLHFVLPAQTGQPQRCLPVLG